MYSERSVDLKSDFYARFGETTGCLYFEKTGLPCSVLDSATHRILFSLNCGVRAYGRDYGDILKIMDSQSDCCDIHFVDKGKGAQILYHTDIEDAEGVDEAVSYTVNKILYKMGSTGRIKKEYTDLTLCDMYAPQGWCAVKEYDTVKSVPLPLSEYNVLLIKGRRNKISYQEELKKQFDSGELDRVIIAKQGLKECREDVFFDMINESQKSIERLFNPPQDIIKAVRSTYGIDGVYATRICDIGIISFCKRRKTDNVINRIIVESEQLLGYPVRISVVK